MWVSIVRRVKIMSLQQRKKKRWMQILEAKFCVRRTFPIDKKRSREASIANCCADTRSQVLIDYDEYLLLQQRKKKRWLIWKRNFVWGELFQLARKDREKPASQIACVCRCEFSSVDQSDEYYSNSAKRSAASVNFWRRILCEENLSGWQERIARSQYRQIPTHFAER